MTSQEFVRAQRLIGWTVQQICDEFDISRRMVFYYRSGEHKVPRKISMLMTLLVKQHGKSLK